MHDVVGLFLKCHCMVRQDLYLTDSTLPPRRLGDYGSVTIHRKI